MNREKTKGEMKQVKTCHFQRKVSKSVDINQKPTPAFLKKDKSKKQRVED